MERARWIAAAAVLCAAGMIGCGGTVNRMDAYNRSGIRMAENGLWQEAAFRWEQAVDLGGNAKVWNNLGVAYEAAERYEDALQAYARALSLDPNNKHFIQNLRRAEMNKIRAERPAPPPQPTEETSESCDSPPDSCP